jgi:hypothetical protein
MLPTENAENLESLLVCEMKWFLSKSLPIQETNNLGSAEVNVPFADV